MDKNKKTRKASLVFEDKIAETVYDPLLEKTQFVVYQNGKMEYLEKVNGREEEIFPLDGRNDIIRKGIVLFPSKPIEYGTDAELVNDIQVFIHKYLEISSMYEQIASYYALFSWLHDRFHEVPYLRAIGDFGSGKSRFLQVIGSICYRPIFTGGATTTAPIFRILNEIRGTLVLDEADLRFSDMTTDIIKILNAGYQKGGNVLRMGGKDMEDLKAFDVFGPKIVATRETFNDKALESRFLVEEMGRGKLRDDIPRRLSDEFWNEARELRNKLLMWRFRNYQKELVYDEKPIEGVHPRLNQIISPLMTIIDDEVMKQSLREFVQKYHIELNADRNLSREADIIFAILKLQKEKGVSEATIGEIAQYVNTDIFDFDDKLTPRKIGWYLRAKLHLHTYRKRGGFTLDFKLNEDRLNLWRVRFGITDEDIEDGDVNVVNVVNDVPPQQPLTGLTAEEVGF